MRTDQILGLPQFTWATPEAALAGLRSALRCTIEAMLVEGYPIPEPASV